MKVAVTGGAGFIGCNLVRRLLLDGLEVAVIDDFSTGRKDNLAAVEGYDLFEGSILDADLLNQAFDGAAAIVHLAARTSVPRSLAEPVKTHEANASGTVRVLEAARRLKNPYVLVASSSSVYGANQCLPKHESLAMLPVSPYAVSKLATEQYALAYSASFGIDVLTFRFFNVFGPFQRADHAYAAVIPAFVAAALNGEPLPVNGDGGQTRDFTYVTTVVCAIAEAINRRVVNDRPVNLAFGSRVSLNDLIRLLEGILDTRLPIDHRPSRIGDVRDSQADSSLLQSLFPGLVALPLPECLVTTVEWHRLQHARDFG